MCPTPQEVSIYFIGVQAVTEANLAQRREVDLAHAMHIKQLQSTGRSSMASSVGRHAGKLIQQLEWPQPILKGLPRVSHQCLHLEGSLHVIR